MLAMALEESRRAAVAAKHTPVQVRICHWLYTCLGMEMHLQVSKWRIGDLHLQIV